MLHSDSNPVLTYDVNLAETNGQLIFEIAPWEENELPFTFKDGLKGCQSSLRYDGATGRLRFIGSNPYAKLFNDTALMGQYLNSILEPVLQPYTFGWSPPVEQAVSYDDNYHSEQGYTQSTEDEQILKSIQAGIVHVLVQPTKTLFAGCSFGEIVRQSRNLHMDTWGFDVIPNLSHHAFPDIQPYLREGSLSAIPYGPEDGFDTMVAIDVFEHLPETSLEAVISELDRMNFDTLVLLINLNDASFLGHITMRPLSWWEDKLSTHFELTHVQSEFDSFPRCYSNDGDYNRQWTVWKRRRAN